VTGENFQDQLCGCRGKRLFVAHWTCVIIGDADCAGDAASENFGQKFASRSSPVGRSAPEPGGMQGMIDALEPRSAKSSASRAKVFPTGQTVYEWLYRRYDPGDEFPRANIPLFVLEAITCQNLSVSLALVFLLALVSSLRRCETEALPIGIYHTDWVLARTFKGRPLTKPVLKLNMIKNDLPITAFHFDRAPDWMSLHRQPHFVQRCGPNKCARAHSPGFFGLCLDWNECRRISGRARITIILLRDDQNNVMCTADLRDMGSWL